MSFAWRKESKFIEEAKGLLKFHYLYENEVIFYFGLRLGQHEEWKNLSIIFRSQTSFPDALLVNFETGEALNVEFEVTSLRFKSHIKKLGEKAIEMCDLIVCSKNNWNDCPLDVYDVISDEFHKANK